MLVTVSVSVTTTMADAMGANFAQSPVKTHLLYTFRFVTLPDLFMVGVVANSLPAIRWLANVHDTSCSCQAISWWIC